MTRALRIWVDPGWGVWAPVATCALAQLLALAGWGSEPWEEEAQADLAYSAQTGTGRLLPSAGHEGWAVIRRASPAAVGRSVLPDAALVQAVSGVPAVDPVLATAFLLGGVHESLVERTQPAGVPGEGIRAWGVGDAPAVDLLAADLAAGLARQVGLPAPRRRWPAGREWALVLTHDCDRMSLYRPLGYLKDAWLSSEASGCRALTRGVMKFGYAAWWGAFRRDPYQTSVDHWLAFEHRTETPATYFIAAASRLEAGQSQLDVGYTLDDRRVRAAAKAIREAGGEIALHSSVEAWARAGGFSREAERLHSALGVAPLGFRAHNWSLRSGREHETLAEAHAQAGFLYDSSLGLDLVAGFRRGTAYPFMPFDPETGVASGLVELPPGAMDDAVWRQSPDPAGRRAALRRVVALAREAKGCLVLDWHSDTLSGSGQTGCMGELALSVLEEIVGDSTCWRATAREVAEWCLIRRWAR